MSRVTTFWHGEGAAPAAEAQPAAAVLGWSG